MRILKIVMLSILSVIGLIILVSMFMGYILSVPVYHGENSDHFNGKEFVNPGDVRQHGFGDLIKWIMNRQQGPWNSIEEFDHGKVKLNSDSSARIYYVNHSTFLLQLGNFNILTDPVWSDRVSPFKWIGPQRKRPPGIKLDELPEIHLVLLSHNHYDHLDISTLRRINDEYHPLMIAPLGVPAYLAENGIGQLREMDWWEESGINENLTIACVPAQHFSGRGMFDRNKTLWGGYVIISEFGNIFFAGDTGYGDFFKDISEKYAPIHLAMLPIGAYIPGWFMSPIHISPDEAVKIHREMKAEKSVAMHFGTFPLGDDGMWQPVNDLEIARQDKQVENFYVLSPGEYLTLE
ncbi:MAG: MBL fold metallo-hydrolase [Cyclobacteriaceae bacterium]|nr:MBL fold metallo-hydrolase [Cyclobacteriaceae bacterium]